MRLNIYYRAALVKQTLLSEDLEDAGVADS